MHKMAKASISHPRIARTNSRARYFAHKSFLGWHFMGVHLIGMHLIHTRDGARGQQQRGEDCPEGKDWERMLDCLSLGLCHLFKCSLHTSTPR
jgi:hypothetical protein